MTREMLGRCGCCRCDLCPAYNGNITSVAGRERVSAAWRDYFGIDVPPEGVGCVGCLNEGTPMAGDCPIRACVLERAIDNCACCDAFMCEKLVSLLQFVEKTAAAHQDAPEEERALFVRPFDNRDRLMELRKAAQTGERG